jgi:hypothetical protein
MNQRIQELAKQAGFRVFGDEIVAADQGISGLATECTQRLVELIVHECAVMAKGFEFAVERDGLSKTMKEHFGVDE